MPFPEAVSRLLPIMTALAGRRDGSSASSANGTPGSVRRPSAEKKHAPDACANLLFRIRIFIELLNDPVHLRFREDVISPPLKRLPALFNQVRSLVGIHDGGS